MVREALGLAAGDIDTLAADLPLGAGTTVTGAVLDLAGAEPGFVVFNVGDSRVYGFLRNELVQVTHDHSVV
ncbi:serine/threonine-protein phosphatase, partial [Schumannella sp. 10F1B-5-1]